MGPCISCNSKDKKNPLKIERQESFYEIFQVNENFNKFIDIPKPHEINLNSLNQNKSLELSDKFGNFASSSIILEESFSSIEDLKRTENISSERCIQGGLSNRTETTKNDSVGQKKGLHSIILQSISEVGGMNKTDEKLQEKPFQSPKDPVYANFASQSLYSLLFSKEKNFELETKNRKWGPKRLTAHNMNFAANLPCSTNFLEIPLAKNDSGPFLPPPMLQYSPSLLMNRESKFIKSFACTEIETLDLLTDGSKVQVFYVPFLKKLSDQADYNLKTIELSDFDFFYKSTEIGEGQNLNRHFKSFPNRWKRGEVPYFIEKSLMFVINSKNESLYNVIIDAIDKLNQTTVIKFICYASDKHPDYLHFDLGKFNRAVIGKYNGRNSVTLNSKADLTVVLHEIMHSLGFMHEHQRERGDSFVYFCKDQLKSRNFVEENVHVCLAGVNLGPFDSLSVMHFHCCENMISYRPLKDGRESGLSLIDCAKINFYYKDFELGDNDINDKWDHMERIAKKSNIDFKFRLESKPR